MSNPVHMENYLKQFGYMENSGARLADHRDQNVSKALWSFQKKWGLAPTGKMNTETKKLMETPRCGCKDITSQPFSGEQSQRYTIHNYGGWSKTDLTYKIVNTSSSLERTISHDTLRRALEEWSGISTLTFTETEATADLDIFFVSRAHVDGYAFDGLGGVLAHAFFPYYGGDIHFDADEYWTTNDPDSGTNLFLVAVHEFGHSLGLKHSSVQKAIMYPFYTYRHSFELDQDDIDGIQSLYGPNVEATTDSVTSSTDHSTAPAFTEPKTASVSTEHLTSSAEPTTTQSETTSTSSPPINPSDPCPFQDLDAITSDKSGDIFIFHGEQYTLIDHNGMVKGFPRNISADFPEILGRVDAVVYLPELIRDMCTTNKKGIRRCYEVIRPEELFLFSGQFYHRYNGGYLQSKNRKDMGLISEEFQGIPSGTTMDAVFTYDGTEIYFISGDMLWKHNRGNHQADSCYPKSISTTLFSGIQNSVPEIRDVLSIPTTSTYYNYFFMADYYFRTTDGAASFDPSQYPRETSKWWCRNNLKNDLGFLKHHTVYTQANGERIVYSRKVEL